MEINSNSIVKRISNNIFVKNVILIASGTAGAQAIAMLAMPFITRLYGPEAFGIFGAFTALVTAIIPIAALTYPVAIVLADSDKEAQKIGGLSLIICCAFSIIVLFFFLFFGNSLVALLNLTQISSFLCFVPLVMVFSVSLQISRQWSIRRQSYRRIASATIIQAMIVNGLKLTLGLIYPKALILIIIYVFGQILQTALLMGKEGLVFFRKAIKTSPVQLKETARKYYDFPFYRAPQVTLNAFSESMPVLFFTIFYGPITAGYYSLARLVLGIPTALIGQSISDVFYPRFVKAYQEGSLKRTLLLNTTLALVAIGLIPYTLIILIGPWLFQLVFGHEWLMAGEFARWLSLWLFATLFTRPIIVVIPVLKMQKFFLIFECVALVARMAAIYLGYVYDGSAVASVIILGVANLLLYVFLLMKVVLKVAPNSSLMN